ncbi:DUF559 domain-containing protein [Hyphomicrobiales bacterium BP6-180914]|uniref:DUF559 domain-containing protein n=2 Tax=Lichenifustis flavocetrariae TaxID=2949735 RepID=A0AA41Z2P6_9HYPH|nr:DUF559 domain-containing protein [Lichenifustis flavocetrariae]MCW6509413.1 DUF559 domain-containing protein [Lichenifustis flavocetrariae]
MTLIRRRTKLSRSLRARSTDTEAKLWMILRGRHLSSMKWRRQVPLGPYIVDFLCFDRRLIVECDGSGHADNAYDQTRDAWIDKQGFKVLRFWNHEVWQNPTGVTDTILARAGLPF